jgi:hypothetical protein
MTSVEGCKCCLDCKKRNIGCHSECEEYIAFKNARIEYLKQKSEETHRDRILREFDIEKSYYGMKFRSKRRWRR